MQFTEFNQDLRARSDLRVFIELSRERRELEVIRGADPYLEMGALYELSLRDKFPRVLLFEDIKGHSRKHRVIMNVRFSRLLVDGMDLEAVRARRARGKRAITDHIPPIEVASGPITSNIVRDDDIDVRAFPAGYWHEGDGGPYIGTECLVIMKDPDSEWINVGTYRTQVHGKRKLTVFIEPGKDGRLIREKYLARGQPCPVVVVVGQAPVLGDVASTGLRYGVSELAIAGGMIGRPIEYVRGEVTGLPIPADAELAFEGFIGAADSETLSEGPFAEWTGYYATDPHPEPVFYVDRVYHRDDPIIVGQPPAKPTFPGRHPLIGRIAALWDALEAAGIAGIKGVWKPVGSGSRFVNIIALTQMHEGHAKMAGLVATGAGPAAFLGRITIIVDDDIDIEDPNEVMWALASRWDPKTQTDIIEGCWSGNLDPTIPPERREVGNFTNSRIIIYAVRPFHWYDRFPKVNAVERKYSDEIEAKWMSSLSFLSERAAGLQK